MELNYYKSMEPFWGTWRIVKQLGEGAYGKVFEITRDDYGTFNSALKVITIPQSESEWQSLMADGMDEMSATSYFQGFVNEITSEIALMSNLKGYSNIVSYEDHSVIKHENGRGWDILIRMELLTPFLNTIPTERSLDREQVIKLGIDICKALEICQSQKIIHRDIKPENIFISKTGDYKLGDFGIARTVEKTMGALSKKGTYTYMAPEVYKGEPYDSTVDIYSLGIVLYRLINRNRAPFLPPYPQPLRHTDREEALNKRFMGTAIPLPIDAQDDLGNIILKACSYNREDRYQTASEMRAALESLCTSEAKSMTNIQSNANELAQENETTVPMFGARTENNKDQYDATLPVMPKPNASKPVSPVEEKNKKKGKAGKIVLIIAGVIIGVPIVIVVLIFILVVILGVASSGRKSSSGKTTSSTSTYATSSDVNTTATQNSSTGTETSSASDTKNLQEGDLRFQANNILVGDSVNASFMAGDMLVQYSPDITFEMSDESVARVKKSSDGQRFVIEALSPGSTKITASDGTYTDTETFRVIEKDEDTVIGLTGESGYRDYSVYIDGGYLTGDDLSDSGIKFSNYGSTMVTVDIFGYFRDYGVTIADYGSDIYIYTSDSISLGYTTDISDGRLNIKLTDSSLYPTSGDLKVVLMDEAGAKAIWAVEIPVELVSN